MLDEVEPHYGRCIYSVIRQIFLGNPWRDPGISRKSRNQEREREPAEQHAVRRKDSKQLLSHSKKVRIPQCCVPQIP